MHAAAGAFVDMYELQEAVASRIAALTHNEAVLVCTGASAGLLLSALGCMTGSDMAGAVATATTHGAAGALPRHEIVVHCAQRNPYDPAVRLAGARLVQVGNVMQTFDWELAVSLGERTAAVFDFAGSHLAKGALPLAEVLRIAHAARRAGGRRRRRGCRPRRACGSSPRWARTWWFSAAARGCAVRKPAALIVGRPDLIDACRLHASPHQRLGRPMKVGKEEMVGLLAAVEWYLAQDHDVISRRIEQITGEWIAALGALPGVSARRDFPSEAGQPLPRAVVTFGAALGLDGAAVQLRLREGDPPVDVAVVGPDAIFLNAELLQPERSTPSRSEYGRSSPALVLTVPPVMVRPATPTMSVITQGESDHDATSNQPNEDDAPAVCWGGAAAGGALAALNARRWCAPGTQLPAKQPLTGEVRWQVYSVSGTRNGAAQQHDGGDVREVSGRRVRPGHRGHDVLWPVPGQDPRRHRLRYGAGRFLVTDTDTPSFIGQKSVLDLDPYVKRDKYDLSDFPAEIINYVRYKGGLYGLPDNSAIIGFYTNAEFVPAARGGGARRQRGYQVDFRRGRSMQRNGSRGSCPPERRERRRRGGSARTTPASAGSRRYAPTAASSPSRTMPSSTLHEPPALEALQYLADLRARTHVAAMLANEAGNMNDAFVQGRLGLNEVCVSCQLGAWCVPR